MSRLSKNVALGPASLRVSNVARTGGWLERVLGLTNLGRSRWGSPAGVPLVALREVPDASPIPRRGRLGIYHYALLLPSRADLGRFLLHLESLGEPYAASDHAVSEAIYLTDPDGITIEVYADRPRETWVQRGTDLVATLDPLDRRAVIAAAGESRWSGFPDGGTMGHLHFYVGDLGAAERFYVGVLGFEPRTRLLPGALFVAADGYHHHLGLNTWAATSPISGPEDAGLDEWALVLRDRAELDALVEQARTNGVAVEERDGDVVMDDPWRIRVRVTANG